MGQVCSVDRVQGGLHQIKANKDKILTGNDDDTTVHVRLRGKENWKKKKEPNSGSTKQVQGTGKHVLWKKKKGKTEPNYCGEKKKRGRGGRGLRGVKR